MSELQRIELLLREVLEDLEEVREEQRALRKLSQRILSDLEQPATFPASTDAVIAVT